MAALGSCFLAARAGPSSRSAFATGGAVASAPASVATTSSRAQLSVVASRVCDLTGKRANNGYLVSFSHRRTKTLQQANLQYKR